MHWSVELQPLVPPALTEEDVDGVLLENTVTEVVWLDRIYASTEILRGRERNDGTMTSVSVLTIDSLHQPLQGQHSCLR